MIVKVLDDSVSRQGTRVTTLGMKIPWFIAAAFDADSRFVTGYVTGGKFSLSRLVLDVILAPYVPPQEDDERGRDRDFVGLWLGMVYRTVQGVVGIVLGKEVTEERLLYDTYGVAREVALAGETYGCDLERALMPFAPRKIIVTSTEWESVASVLMAVPDGDEVAERILRAISGSVPTLRCFRGAHLPLVGEVERQTLATPEEAVALSASRMSTWDTYDTTLGSGSDEGESESMGREFWDHVMFMLDGDGRSWTSGSGMVVEASVKGRDKEAGHV